MKQWIVVNTIILKQEMKSTAQKENKGKSYTVKTAFYDLCGQRLPAFYDQNSIYWSLCTEKSLWWATTCHTHRAICM